MFNRRQFLLASSLAIGATACSNATTGASTSGSAAGSTAITYWLWQDNATDTTWADLAKEFNAAQKQVQVTLETIPLDQYQNKLTTAIMNGTGPDAARCKDWWVGQLAPQGALAGMNAMTKDWSGKSDVIESLWETGRLPGKDEVYMLPHQYVTLYMYYRKDYFAEIGAAAPKSQEEFLAAAQKLTNSKRYAMDVRGGGGGQDQWLAWMFAGGAKVVDAKGAVVLDDATAISVNQRYLDIVQKYKAAPPGSITAAFADVKKNFADGLTAMMIHHPGSLKEMVTLYGDKLGVIPVPTGDGQPGATLGSMSGNVIMSASKKQAAAWKWISWLCERAPMAKMSLSAQGQLPVLNSVSAQKEFTDDKNLAVAVQAIKTAKAWPALAGVSTLAGKEWNPTIQQAFQGQLTSEAAMKKMADVLRKS